MSSEMKVNTIDRRGWFRQTAGFSALASAVLLGERNAAKAVAGEAAARQQPTFPPTAKSVIFLFMSGAPSQVDTFDPKPALRKLADRDVPESLAKNVPRIKRAGLRNLMPSPWKFSQYGESGIPVSQLFPATARHVDRLCVLRSLHHRNPVHGPAEVVTLTGTQQGNRPSLGAWLQYGLGSENEELPGFFAMNLNTAGQQFPQAAGWSSGFLPAEFQATAVDANSGIRDIELPSGMDRNARRSQLDLITWLNRRHSERLPPHSEIQARTAAYELSFRMQSAAPELFDLSRETAETHALYGTDRSVTANMGRHCLLARRMVERGVRFVQIRFGGWDAHSNLKKNHETQAAKTDQPVAGLLADLDRCGLLDDTLVVWGGEFGRTPTMEGSKGGRDHSPAAYTMWLAGGGVRGGQIIGRTDEIGYTPVERPLRPSDLHATILHALGIDQYKLVFEHNGREELATVLGGEVITEAFG